MPVLNSIKSSEENSLIRVCSEYDKFRRTYISMFPIGE